MKTKSRIRIAFALLLGLSTVCFVSCQKEDTMSNDASPSQISTPGKINEGQTNNGYSTKEALRFICGHFDTRRGDCSGANINCICPVSIHGGVTIAAQLVLDSSINQSNGVKAFFNSKYALVLFPNLFTIQGLPYLTQLTTLNNNITKIVHGSKSYYTVTPAGTSTVAFVLTTKEEDNDTK